MDDLINVLGQVRACRPIVQLFPDAAAGRDVASLLSASGALPILSESASEAAEIARASHGLCLNLTAPTSHRNYAMNLACQTAFQMRMPVVLNALHGHLSRMRIQSLQSLLDIGVALLVCDPELFSRLKFPYSESAPPRRWRTTELVETARRLAIRWRTTIVAPGAGILIVSPGTAALVRDAASPCVPGIAFWGAASGIFAACLASKHSSQSVFDVALSAVATFSSCAEIVAERCPPGEDPIGFRHEFLRTLFRVSPEQVRERSRVELL